MQKIAEGKERGKTQGYRAVHFFLHKALLENWKIDFYPIEKCTKENVNTYEKQRIKDEKTRIEQKIKLNKPTSFILNYLKTWRVSQLNELSLEYFLAPKRPPN